MAKKILVVDDEKNIVFVLSARLKGNGFEVVTAQDGNSGIAAARQEKPDLIILDVTMPPPNGYQVCRTLKDEAAFKNTPIIMLTAKTTESDQFWGMEAGADAYVTKPYNSEELLSKIKELLQKQENPTT